MSAEATIKKGDTVRVTRSGVEGQVFWEGKSRYGEGRRFGVRDAGGEAHWVDEAEVALVASGGESGAGTKEKTPTSAPKGDALTKGSLVRILSKGDEGEIFWAGPNRYGEGWRYGVRDNQGATHWVDETDVELIQAGPASSSAPRSAPKAPPEAQDLGDYDDSRADDFVDSYREDEDYFGD